MVDYTRLVGPHQHYSAADMQKGSNKTRSSPPTHTWLHRLFIQRYSYQGTSFPFDHSEKGSPGFCTATFLGKQWLFGIGMKSMLGQWSQLQWPGDPTWPRRAAASLSPSRWTGPCGVSSGLEDGGLSPLAASLQQRLPDESHMPISQVIGLHRFSVFLKKSETMMRLMRPWRDLPANRSKTGSLQCSWPTY